jgi:DNA-binding MarR family transcriptional regulator
MKKDLLIQQIIEELARCQKAGATSSVWRKIGISHAQVGMLFITLHHKNANVKQISEHLGVTKSAVTQLLDPLVNNGFIKRQNDARDRRIVRMSLTKKGEQTLKEVNTNKFANLRNALKTLSEEEIAQLARLHKKAIDNLNQQITP